MWRLRFAPGGGTASLATGDLPIPVRNTERTSPITPYLFTRFAEQLLVAEYKKAVETSKQTLPLLPHTVVYVSQIR